MPIPSKIPSEMICRNLRSVTPPIDYPLEKGRFDVTQSNCSKINGRNVKMSNGDVEDNQEQVVVLVDGRRIVRKKKRKCVKCKLNIIKLLLRISIINRFYVHYVRLLK